MGNKSWRVSSNGPDWIDVTALMTGLSGIHELNVELTVTTVTQGASGLLRTTACAWKPVVVPQKTEVVAEVVGTWPDKEHASYGSYVYWLLFELDKAIGRAYDQKVLPE